MKSLVDIFRDYAKAVDQQDLIGRTTATAKLLAWLRERLPPDPASADRAGQILLAEGVDAPALQQKLRAIASHPQPSATALGLVLDREGEGHVVEIVVVLSPGGDGAWTPQAVEADAETAAGVAAAVALPNGGRGWGVVWQVCVDGPFRLRGGSIALPVAMAARAAWLGQELPKDVAFTGGVVLNGQLTAVQGLPAKARAALKAGVGGIAMARDNAHHLPVVPQDLRLISTDRLEEMFEAMGLSAPTPAPAPRRSPSWALAAGGAALTAMVLAALWSPNSGPKAKQPTLKTPPDMPQVTPAAPRAEDDPGQSPDEPPPNSTKDLSRVQAAAPKPTTQSLSICATVNNKPAPLTRPIYNGDTLRLRMTPPADGFLYLVNVGPHGDVTVLFPDTGEDNRVLGGKSEQVPPPDVPPIVVTDPTGPEELYVLWSASRLPSPDTLIDRMKPSGTVSSRTEALQKSVSGPRPKNLSREDETTTEQKCTRYTMDTSGAALIASIVLDHKAR